MADNVCVVQAVVERITVLKNTCKARKRFSQVRKSNRTHNLTYKLTNVTFSNTDHYYQTSHDWFHQETSVRLTVFKQQADGVDGVSAEQHDGIFSGGLGEGLSLTVGVEAETSALVEEVLMGRRYVGPSEEQLLKEIRPERRENIKLDLTVQITVCKKGPLRSSVCVCVCTNVLTCCMCECRCGGVSPAADWRRRPRCGVRYRWSRQRTGRSPNISPGLPLGCWPALEWGDSEDPWNTHTPSDRLLHINQNVSGTLTYFERLQEIGISELHSIFPFSNFWWPEIAPDGFSVMILYLPRSQIIRWLTVPGQTDEAEVCLMAPTSLLCSCAALRRVWTAGCQWRRDKTWLRCSTGPPWLRISFGDLSSAPLARTCQDAANAEINRNML